MKFWLLYSSKKKEKKFCNVGKPAKENDSPQGSLCPSLNASLQATLTLLIFHNYGSFFKNHTFSTCILTSIQPQTLSLSPSPAVWLYGASGWEGEVERGRVSTGEEEHPNCGPQWGGVCPVPGRWCLAPGFLQRWPGEGDCFLQHKCHRWDRSRICRCRKRWRGERRNVGYGKSWETKLLATSDTDLKHNHFSSALLQ